MKEAKHFKSKKVKWLWHERIPLNMISVVAGKPDVGKGLFGAHLAAQVSRAGHNVLYSAMEDDFGLMTRPRLEAAGADLNRVFLWRFRMPQQFSELVNHVVDNDVKLVFIDPFAAHLGRGVSRHADSIRDVTTPLSDLAEKAECAVVITEHALKRVKKDAHPLDAIGGNSSGLPAASRMGFIFGVDPDDSDRRLLCCVKHNIRDEPKALAFDTDTDELPIVGEVPSLLNTGECEFDALRLLVVDKSGNGKPGRNPDKRASAAEWLTNHLAAAGGKLTAGQVREDAKQHGGISAKTLRRAADDMGVVKNPPGGGPKCTWELPPEVLKAMGLTKKQMDEAFAASQKKGGKS